MFNATVEETRRRRHQAGYLAESSIAAAATAVVRLNGATPAFQESGQLTKHCMQEIRVTQEIPQNVRQSLYQPKALRVDIYASHAGNFIGHRGRNCKYWVNEIQGVNDIFVLGHPDTQGTRKVAIISWYSGGQEGRERVRDLIKEFNIKTGSGDLSCEWLDEASRAWFREEQGDDGNIGKGRNKFRPRRRREDRERRQFELQGTDAVNYFGAA